MNLIKKIISNNKGFSLVEMLVCVIIIPVVFGGVFSVVSMVYKSQVYNYEVGANIQEGEKLTSLLNNEIKNAIQINTVDTNNVAYRCVDDKSDRTFTLSGKKVIFNNPNAKKTETFGADDRITAVNFKSLETGKGISAEITMQSPKVTTAKSTITFNAYALNLLH